MGGSACGRFRFMAKKPEKKQNVKPEAATTGVSGEAAPENTSPETPATPTPTPDAPAPGGEPNDTATTTTPGAAPAKKAKKAKPKAVRHGQGVWGIDLGQCSLKAVRLEEIDGVVTVTA